MKSTAKKSKGIFNLADGLIITVCAVLITVAVVFYLVPAGDSETALPTVEATVQLAFSDDESLTHIAKGDKVFSGEKLIGEVKTVDGSFNMISVTVTLDKSESGYSIGGTPVWENGSFTLETRLRELEGTVTEINVRGEER